MGLNQANRAITVVRWDADRPPALVGFNDTGHPHGGPATSPLPPPPARFAARLTT